MNKNPLIYEKLVQLSISQMKNYLISFVLEKKLQWLNQSTMTEEESFSVMKNLSLFECTFWWIIQLKIIIASYKTIHRQFRFWQCQNRMLIIVWFKIWCGNWIPIELRCWLNNVLINICFELTYIWFFKLGFSIKMSIKWSEMIKNVSNQSKLRWFNWKLGKLLTQFFDLFHPFLNTTDQLILTTSVPVLINFITTMWIPMTNLDQIFQFNTDSITI